MALLNACFSPEVYFYQETYSQERQERRVKGLNIQLMCRLQERKSALQYQILQSQCYVKREQNLHILQFSNSNPKQIKLCCQLTRPHNNWYILQISNILKTTPLTPPLCNLGVIFTRENAVEFKTNQVNTNAN